MGMLVGIVAAVLLLACLFFAGSCSSRTASGPSSGAAPNRPPVVLAAGMKSLDRAAIRAMLKRLANTPAPENTSFGAMCYKPASLPKRADYVCPKCGERTLYDDSKLSTEEWVKNGLARIVEREIPSCRREFQGLRKVAGDAMTLDESQFCRKCSPSVTEPKLVLHICYDGGKVRDIEKIDHGDLRMLREFLNGELLTTGDNEGEYPLKEFLPRLQELLGVKLDE
jgi:hypothetical protein